MNILKINPKEVITTCGMTGAVVGDAAFGALYEHVLWPTYEWGDGLYRSLAPVQQGYDISRNIYGPPKPHLNNYPYSK